MRPEALYIHVPFCLRRCSYCDFAVQAVRVAPVAEWLDAITTEARLLAEQQAWAAPLRLQTVYVGGGTPSLVGTGAMAELRRRLEPFAGWNDTAEWTAEANPETFDTALALDWRAAGINRLSLGAQTFHEPALSWMGRLHGPDGPARALEAARAAGFENVSIDLIFGLPARLGRDWDDDLERALALEPEHISLYGLTAEPGAPLGRWVSEGRERLADEETYAAEYLRAAECLSAGGFRHYEVSNFARAGRESRHNQTYWTGAAYLGLGPGAHSYLPPLRRWNVRDWGAYRAALHEGRLATDGEEQIDTGKARLERIWLALRTSVGLRAERLSGAQRRLLEQWVGHGWAHVREQSVRLTPAGWLLLDRLAVELESAA